MPDAAPPSLPLVMPPMFTPVQAAVATFLGSPLPGLYLLSRNYRAAGQARNARFMLIVGGVVTTLLIVLAINLPDGTPHSLLPIISTVCVHQMAAMGQGPLLGQHALQGGKTASWWAAIGYGLLGMIVVLAVLLVVALVQPEE
jgi:hypothetical protein